MMSKSSALQSEAFLNLFSLLTGFMVNDLYNYTFVHH